MRQRLAAIVFDWDGTLVDSMAPIAAAVRAAARDCDLPDPGEEAARSVIGLGLQEVGYRLFPEADEAAFRAWAERYRDLYWAAPQDFFQLFPGVEAMLERLAERYPLAVATGKGRRGLDLALAHTGLDRYLVASRCADETRSKPHPQMLEELFEELTVQPADTLVVGDTSYDMEMARAAGSRALGVAGGSHPADVLRQAGAETVLGHTIDLIEWLDK